MTRRERMGGSIRPGCAVVVLAAASLAQHAFLGPAATRSFRLSAEAFVPPSRTTRQLAPAGPSSRGRWHGHGRGSSPPRAADIGADGGMAGETSGSEPSSVAGAGDGSGGGTPAGRQTLYEILGAPPDATKAELKRQYVLMARETHPDALIGRDGSDGGMTDPSRPDFNEVASAWRVLSDPLERKRYDRSLKADMFVERAEKLAGKVGESAGQVISETLDNVAVPLYKKAATAWGSIANDTADKKKEDVDLRSAFMSAVDAAKRAGKAVSRNDMLEKCEDLEKRAVEDTKAAEAVKDELAEVMQGRLQLALRTPGSALSSLEAMKLLDGFNTLDTRSITDLVMLRKTVSNEIDALEKVEANYFLKYDEKVQSELEYEKKSGALRQAKINAESAMDAERRARAALKAAQELVASTSKAVEECTNSLKSIEKVKQTSLEEAERLASALERRQERVRMSLRRKEEAILNKSGMAVSEASGGDAIEKNVQQLEELRKKERFLMAEGVRLENRALRHQSRAAKLREKADFLEDS